MDGNENYLWGSSTEYDSKETGSSNKARNTLMRMGRILSYKNSLFQSPQGRLRQPLRPLVDDVVVKPRDGIFSCHFWLWEAGNERVQENSYYILNNQNAKKNISLRLLIQIITL